MKKALSKRDKKVVGSYVEKSAVAAIDDVAKTGHRTRSAQIAMVLEDWARATNSREVSHG